MNETQSTAEKLSRKVMAIVAEKASVLRIEGFEVNLLGPEFPGNIAQHWGIRAGKRNADHWIDIWFEDEYEDESVGPYPATWMHQITADLDVVGGGIIETDPETDEPNMHEVMIILFGVAGLD